MDVESLCRELGMKTQADLAARLGVTVTYLSDLKAGRRQVSLRFAQAVEKATGREGLVAAVVARRTAPA